VLEDFLATFVADGGARRERKQLSQSRSRCRNVESDVVPVPSGIVSDIAELGRFAASRGWVPATSGNFSHRIDAETIAVTRSGRDKGNLTGADIVAIRLADPIPPGVSAETPLHVARYKADPTIGAIAHVHSVTATVLSRLFAKKNGIVLGDFEMLKALDGFTTHETDAILPVFANAQETAKLARTVEKRLARDAAVPGYLLAGHGLYAWGVTAVAARRHLEGLEFLLSCALEERRLRR
jgi:methylthioribulose-1-phosphate dehydratase